MALPHHRHSERPQSLSWRVGTLLLFLLVCVPSPARLLLVGSPEIPTLRAALQQAHPGDTLRLLPGIYREQELTVTVPLLIEGTHSAIIDGEGKGQILQISASGTTIRGLTFRRSGLSFLRDNAAIRVEGATDCRIEQNRLEECFFGIYLAKAARCTVEGNIIAGQAQREATSGNGIHAWYCRDLVVRANVVMRHRDGIYFEFVRHSLVEHNTSENNLRYGLHFMFSDSCRYAYNLFRGNRSGVAVMYSHSILVQHNRFEYNWGSSAYGLLLKDISRSRIQHNLFLSNTTGLYMESATDNLIDSNRLQANGWALRLMASSTGNLFVANSFVANTTDLATNSSYTLNTFRANYWSRYRGYDLNRDGYGDTPFYPVNAFAILTERYPALLMLLRSFIVELLELAERIFPVLIPAAISDPTPLIAPAV